MKLNDWGTVMLAALVAMGLIVVAVTITGKSQELCDLMGGKYTPENGAKGEDVCPGGAWRNLYRAAEK